MTPAEVIAMRDKLAEWLNVEGAANRYELADALIASGWVTSEPMDAPEKPEPVLTDCSACGSTNTECMNRIRSKEDKPCCGRCHYTDTHNQFGGSDV